MKTVLQILLFLIFSITLSAQIVNIEDRRQRLQDSIGWQGNVDLGFGAVQNTRQILNARFSNQTEYGNRKHFGMGIVAFNFLQSDGQSVSNDGFGHIRYNYDLRKKLVLEVFTQLQYNELLRMRMRALGGAGLRFKLRPWKGQRLYVGVAWMYEYNELSDRQTYHYQRITSYVSANFPISKNVKLISTSYMQPTLQDLSNMRLASENSLFFQITKHLSFRSGLSLQWDADPVLPEEVPNYTYTLTNGLRFEF